MKSLTFAIVTLFPLLLLTSCEKINGKGDVVSESRTVTGYSGISLEISADVYYTAGNEYLLELQGQENVLKQVTTKIEGNDLEIRLKKGVILGPHEQIRVYITAPGIERLDISGSGDMHVGNTWPGTELSVDINGSGNLTVFGIEADHFRADISGSGSITVYDGTANREDLEISGSGDIDMRDVEAKQAFTDISGSGNMYVFVTEQLDVSISGSGDVYYLGTPSMTVDISGSGKVRKL